MKETELTETLAYEIQTPGNYSEDIIQQIKNTLKELIAAYFKYCSNICLYGKLST